MVITLTNAKGGVGVTATSVTLAQFLAMSSETYIIDFDEQSDVAKSLNLQETEGVYNLFDSGEVEAFEVDLPAGNTLNAITSNQDSIIALKDIFAAKLRMNPNALNILAERLRKMFAKKNVVIDTAKSGIVRDVGVAAADIIIIPTALDSKSAANTVRMVEQMQTLKRETSKIVILPMFLVKRRATVQDEAVQMLTDATEGKATVYKDGIPATVALENAEWAGRTIYTSPDCRPLLAAYQKFFSWLLG